MASRGANDPERDKLFTLVDRIRSTQRRSIEIAGVCLGTTEEKSTEVEEEPHGQLPQLWRWLKVVASQADEISAMLDRIGEQF